MPPRLRAWVAETIGSRYAYELSLWTETACFVRRPATGQALDSCGGDAYIRKWNPVTARQGGNPCRRVHGRHDTPL
jgi:hypothetical protein